MLNKLFLFGGLIRTVTRRDFESIKKALFLDTEEYYQEEFIERNLSEQLIQKLKQYGIDENIINQIVHELEFNEQLLVVKLIYKELEKEKKEIENIDKSIED